MTDFIIAGDNNVEAIIQTTPPVNFVVDGALKGDKGDQGLPGNTGTAATVAVGTVATGAAGSSVAISNSGTSVAAVLNFSIPKGDTGATGPQGPAGTGAGDMLKATYDPTTKNADAFSQDNMTSGTTNKNYTATEQTKLAAITGTNTGDETTATIKTKLGITTLSGSNTGDQTTITGNAGTATKLQTARNIAGVAFDGTANISIASTNLSDTASIVLLNSTQTLTNKRYTPRVGTVASSATPTINTDNIDVFTITALAVDITSFTTNLSGTPTDSQQLSIYITGTATRNITWGTSFESGASTLPTATSGTTRLEIGFVWNAATSKWRCMASSAAAGASGTVTSVSVTTANGVSGTVATATTTPAISLALGDITPTSVNINETTPSTTVPYTATVNGSAGNVTAVLAQDGTTYAYSGNLVRAVLMNATDTGIALRLENAGSGKSISSTNGTTETFSVDKAGAILSAGIAVPTISSTSIFTNKDLTSGTNTFPTFNQNTTGSAAKLTTARTIAGVSFDGTANIALASTNLSDTASIVLLTSTQTLTNKRVTKRVTTSSAPGATPTWNTDNVDRIRFTGLAAAITSMTTNLTGTPADGDEIWVGFIDNGTARAITWGAKFVSSGVATLLATTVINKQHWVKLEWDSVKSLWVCMAVDAVGY